MVVWKELKEVFDTRNGYTPSTTNESFWEGGNIPWFKMEDIRDKGGILNDSYLHITETAVKGKGLFKANSILLATSATIGEHALITVDHLSNQRFTNLYPKAKYEHEINMRYVYYYMFKIDEWCKQHINQGGFASVDMGGLYRLAFPIPPLSEQQRIVDILDTFTSSIENLKEQIAQRRKQYEYYRDQLLDLEGKPGVEMKTLGEVCEISGDYGLSAPSKPYDGVRYLRITDITDSGGLNNEYVSADLKEDVVKEPLVDGDILFARTGATVGKTLVYRSNFGKCLFAGYLIRYRARKQVVFPQYLFHFTHSTKYYNWVSASLAVGAQPNISAQRYNQLQFPLPPLSEQQRIVSILDTFEASIQNLEAQLEQRQKQYEYYRNKLLTFEGGEREG